MSKLRVAECIPNMSGKELGDRIDVGSSGDVPFDADWLTTAPRSSTILTTPSCPNLDAPVSPLASSNASYIRATIKQQFRCLFATICGKRWIKRSEPMPFRIVRSQFNQIFRGRERNGCQSDHLLATTPTL